MEGYNLKRNFLNNLSINFFRRMLRAAFLIVGGLATIVGGFFSVKDGVKIFKDARAQGKPWDFKD